MYNSNTTDLAVPYPRRKPQSEGTNKRVVARYRKQFTFKGDMTTRALVCRIDARVERPETRRFDVDLKVEVPGVAPN